MILVPLVFLGGVLTILSPCVLPVLPFVFARAEQPFFKSGLPMLAGMALTFAGIATLAAVGGAWAVSLNQYGRVFALSLLAVFAATLLSRRLANLLARPFQALGNRLIPASDGSATAVGVAHSVLLGVATGLLWAPCAGPILGLILTGAALSGPNAQTVWLLLAYAGGAATSLGMALLAGRRLFETLKQSLGAGEWIRRGLGLAVMAAVVAISLGWDSEFLTALSLNGTNRLEQSLVEQLDPATSMDDHSAMRSNVAMSGTNTMMMQKVSGNGLPLEGELPSLAGATAWLNSAALTPATLRGKVVLVDFWTYSCINCLRSLPYVNTWYRKYKDHGLVVIGVHAPEFAFEKDLGNVRHAVAAQGIAYPVAIDNDYAIWRGFNNQYWPAHYFIDARGHIRGHHFGEGDYDESEHTIRQLLTEAGFTNLPPEANVHVAPDSVQAASDASNVLSPETYVGFGRAENFSSIAGFIQNQPAMYALPAKLDLNHWGLAGNWQVDEEKAALTGASGRLVYRFHARDLHLVAGPDARGKPVRFRVLLDGAPPALNRGGDVDANGYGVIRDQRLYQLIRQSGAVADHTFAIDFLDGGAQVFSFTFG